MFSSSSLKYSLFMKYNIKIYYIFLLLLNIFINKRIYNLFYGKMNNIKTNKIKNKQQYTFYNLLNINIENNTILIFEPRNCHNECTPGYSKYFIELGYNVDILLRKSGVDSLSYFNDINKIRVFIYDNLTQIMNDSENLSSIIKQYNYVLVESTDKRQKQLYNKLGLLNINNSIFVFHEIGYAGTDFDKYFSQNRIWTLGNISNGLEVNPHYFGNININEKNKITRFFLTSTINRNYKPLIDSVNKLAKGNFNFEIVVTGRSYTFNQAKIPRKASNKFIFKHGVEYSELYRLVNSSDYIIILLDPKNKYDNLFKTSRVTGSYQLSLGFLKPSLINEAFAEFYYFNNQNSLIYKELDLYSAMKRAILLNKYEYKKMQNALQMQRNEIHKIAIKNIKKFIVNNN